MPAAASLRTSPTTALVLASALAATAASEYAGAEDGGRILEVIEYQDGRGLLRQADQLLSLSLSRPDISDAMRARLRDSRRQIGAMLRAFPSIEPPANAIISASQLRLLVPQTADLHRP